MSETITAPILWISVAPISWLLAEQHSSTVRVIKYSTLLADSLTRSITWLSRGELEVALKSYVTGRQLILVTPTSFSRRFKFSQTVALFHKSIKELIHNFRSHSQPNLNLDAVKELYRTAGDMVIGKPPLVWKPWMSNTTWALIKMRNNLKKDIEATLRL